MKLAELIREISACCHWQCMMKRGWIARKGEGLVSCYIQIYAFLSDQQWALHEP